jgi:PelA/Pel-15E family pectate lyase
MFAVELLLNITMKKHTLIFILLFVSTLLSAEELYPIKLNKLRDDIHHWNLEHPVRNYSRLDSSEVMQIADNFLAWQNKDGGWPKNIDWLGVLNVDSVRNALDPKYRESTLDNRNTWPQIAYLSEVYTLTKKIKYKDAAEKGLRYILASQNASGGWRGWDVDAITYNDEVMTGVMNLFLDIQYKKKIYAWIKDPLYTQICNSLNKAVAVTLRCQIVVDGVKTAWCQQHDHKTLAPVKARSFELVSITANESADVLICLMRIKDPSDEIRDAIEAGVKWLEKSKITGIKIVKVKVPKSRVINEEYPYDLVVKKDPKATPIWARFYEIETNKPFMCTRKGTKVYKLSEVNPERRIGYSWYGNWPEKVLAVYEKWVIIYGNK